MGKCVCVCVCVLHLFYTYVHAWFDAMCFLLLHMRVPFKLWVIVLYSGVDQLGEWEFQLYLWEVLEVRQEVTKWQMAIYATGYWRSVLGYVAVLYTIKHLAICS